MSSHGPPWNTGPEAIAPVAPLNPALSMRSHAASKKIHAVVQL